jgi:hypothetical protein
MEHVVIRRLDHVTGSPARPALGYAIETRDRPGPAHKTGAFPGDPVWIQLAGGLVVATAAIELCWIGEFSDIREVRARVGDSPIGSLGPFWKGRPRCGYAAVAGLTREKWIEPFWAGPRNYAYEWVLLEDDKKRRAWLEPKPPPRTKSTLAEDFKRKFGARSGP